MTITASDLQATLPTSAQPAAARQLPVVGPRPLLLRDPLRFFQQAQARHGDIYLLDLGVLRMVMLNHSRHIDHVLIRHAQNYQKPSVLMRQLLGDGLFTTEGDQWLRQRRLLQPHFHRQRVAGMVEAMVQTIDAALATWDPAVATQQPFAIDKGFAALTMQVIARTLFGQALDAQMLVRVQEAMTYILDYLMVGGPLTCRLPAWLPRPGVRRYQAARRVLDTVIAQVIARERNAPQASDSMLAMLLQMVDEEDGTGMTDQQLHDELLTFLVAGYETTSLALTWAVHLLTRHPPALHKVEEEIASVLPSRMPTVPDLGALRYTRMVLQETMRIRPPAWWLPRRALAADEIDGYAIPAGTTVVNFVYAIHHHADLWPDPERFDPERFSPEQLAHQPKHAWTPFGAGQRQCIARDFAMMEAQLVLAMLVQRYHLAPEAGPLATPVFGTTLKPKRDIRVQLTHRTRGGKRVDC
ncbi:MAG: cytochrome P450 [Caldilineaceae bacterium]|nr:cytochrome P450 [Caldilineaceae bacterium]